MTRKNSKNVSMALLIPAPFALILILVSILAVGYLAIDVRCEAIGRDIKALEKKIEVQRGILRNEQLRWSQMKSPESLKHALKQFNLSMEWPRRDQIVRLNPDDPDAPSVEPGGAFLRDKVALAGIKQVGAHD